MKLRTKILSYTLPLILIPFLLMSVAVYYFVIRGNQIQAEEEKSQRLNEAIVSCGQEIDFARKDIKLLSSVPAIAEYLRQFSKEETPEKSGNGDKESQAKTLLKLFFEQNPYYVELSLVDKKGNEKIKFTKVPNKEDLKNLKNEAFFRRTLISGSVQTPVREIQAEKYVTIFTQAVFTDEEFLGMLVLSLNTEVFERILRPLVNRGLLPFLFDDRGVVLADAFSSMDERALLDQMDLKDEANVLLTDSSIFENERKLLKGENRSYLLSFKPSESFPRVDNTQMQAGTNWFLGVLDYQKTATVPVNFQAIFFSILMLAVGAVLFLAAKASRYITIPLEQVNLATLKVARGDTDLDLDIKTGDEVEDLANAVKQMNFELQDYQKQIVQTAKLATMGEMTSEISHEIQNRISGISLWLQHLDSETEKDDPRQEYLDEMKQGLKGFMEMLGSLKEYYKTPTLVIKDIDLNSLIKETLPFIGEEVKNKSITVKTELNDDLPFIQGDTEKLKGVILNILLNGVDSLGENGLIEIQTYVGRKLNNDFVYLKISDNGSGIKKGDLSKIFYPFFSTKPGGSGLGLAISSNIITTHQGQIEVESEEEKGTEFKISLPFSERSDR